MITSVPPVGAGFPVATSSCACGRDQLPAAAQFCGQCGSELGPLPTIDPATVPDPHGLRAEQPAPVEAALRKTMRDVADGHIGLWGVPGAIRLDRIIDPRLRGIDWVAALLLRGWVQQARGSRVLVPTDAGRQVAAEAGLH